MVKSENCDKGWGIGEERELEELGELVIKGNEEEEDERCKEEQLEVEGEINGGSKGQTG